MPELPEVETVRQQLKPLIIGKKIVDISIIYDKIIKISNDEFKKKLIHQTFRDISRYGKYLLFELDDYTLVSHLRMEGKYYLRQSINELTKHEHVVFHLSNDMYLTYHDFRKFGTMELVKKGDEFLLDSLKKLGPEVNDTQLIPDRIYPKIKKSSRPIKSLLLDQSIMTGLGNIYVDETLFLAKIHPEKKGHQLSFEEVECILKSAKQVIQKAIDLGGTTIRSYQSTLGVDGRFQNELNVHTLVGKACSVCQEEIIKIKVGGRGTYLCPNCQRKESL
ncbi:DNA-formamidopyrimidine glycosylase [Mycoplasmatota bacterium]|nr:DNA-formamidopyrimidine glycosylase [Mycoplasmatota bacterium]